MNIDIKAKEIKPVRQTYSHIARRFGTDKPATRYQEAVYDVQAVENFHYRPTWQPEKELYDPSRTALSMKDWYDFLDPRQYYYGNYCMARARQQDSAEQNFKFVEKRGLVDTLPDAVKDAVMNYVLPLRHYEWGANMNNYQICAMGYGTALTAPASMAASDHLGVAQYLTRIGLLISGNDAEAIDAAKQRWMEDPALQGLRRLVENSLVVEDWFELFVAQNLVFDGLVYPLVYDRFEAEVANQGGAAYAMLTEFPVEWFAETRRWVDKTVSVACAESDQNRDLVTKWFDHWLGEARVALEPYVAAILPSSPGVLDGVVAELKKRAEKSGITV